MKASRSGRVLRWGWGGVLAFNAAVTIWLLVAPAPAAVFTLVANIAYAVGPLLAVGVFLPTLFRQFRARQIGDQDDRNRLAAAAALLTGTFCFAVGQTIWTIYENVLPQRTPFPSSADVVFLSAYLFMLAGVMLLPNRRAPLLARGRLLMDAVMTMAAILTFSWYFVLAPQVATSDRSAFVTALGLLYPTFDLILFFCVLLFLGGRIGGFSRGGAIALSIGFVCVGLVDSAFMVGVLHNTYVTGGLMDVGWPVGYMLIPLAAGHILLDVARVPTPTRSANVAPRSTSWCATLLPYALMPATLALIFTIYRRGEHDLRSVGSYTFAVLLFVLLIVRQLLVLFENERLCRQLRVSNASLAESNEQLKSLATTDAMTRLANHRAMQDRLREEVARSSRTRQPVAFLLIDVDLFKSLNDQFGHPAGDEVLRVAAQVICANCRVGDLPARYGGEEFAVICPMATAQEVASLGERIRAAIAAHPFVPRPVTVSIGVSGTDVVGLDADRLIRSADEALYASKRGGRNRVTIATFPRLNEMAFRPSPLTAMDAR